MQAADMNSLKKETKIKKLKELRKMMQKKMLDSFSSGDTKKMVSKVLEKSERKKEPEAKEKEKPDGLKAEMKAFFQKSNSLPPSGKTKVLMPSAPSAKTPPPPRKK